MLDGVVQNAAQDARPALSKKAKVKKTPLPTHLFARKLISSQADFRTW